MMQKTKVTKAWNEALIDFAFRLYEEPSVESRCIKLQDDFHANVNILLWTCWLEAEGINISSEWLDDVLITIDTPTQLIVSRLRDVRQSTKSLTAFSKTQAKIINKYILQAELTAEKVFLHKLQDLTRSFIDAEKGADTPLTQALDCAYYLEFLGIPDTQENINALRSFYKKARILEFPVT